MKIIAQSNGVKVSTRKIRLVADAVREMSPEQAIAMLIVLRKRGAVPVLKTLQSAIANAVNNQKLNRQDLLIGSIEVTEGQALKRFHPSTRGRIHPYKKRSSNIRITLTEKEKEVKAQTAKK